MAGRCRGGHVGRGHGQIFAAVPGMKTLMAYWYHFIIMFEALFILTLLETGTGWLGSCFRRPCRSSARPRPPATTPVGAST